MLKIFSVVVLLTLCACASDAPAGSPEIRQAARQFWNPIITQIREAARTVDTAHATLASGDTVGAQQYLNHARDEIQRAHTLVMTEPPGDSQNTWTSIGAELSDAIDKYTSGINEQKQAIDASSSAAAAQSLDDFSTSAQEIAEATASAKQWYKENGGNPAELQSI